MSNYTKTTDFAAKDSLPTGDSGKIIRGAEFETEFDAIATAIATKADTAGPTFTGTLTFETISDGTISVTAFVDEDNMASNSATLVPTQQSVKAYVDSVTTELQAQDLDFQADSGGALSIDLDTETMTFTGGTGIDTSGSGNAVTFAIDSTVTTLTGTQTLTNKTLTTPVISSISNTGTLTLPTSTDTLVGRATTDTLTNKTLTSPVISTISNTGTITLPTSTDTLVGRATTDTLTNKTLTSAVLNTGVSGTAVLDEDNMASNSATQLATQQSIKAYVDATVAATNEVVEDTTPQLGGNLDTNGSDILFADNDKAIFGAGSDLQIYHTGSVSVIEDSGTGNLLIRGTDMRLQNAAGDNNYLKAIDGAEVELMYGGATKLATTNTGIDVTGVITTDGMTTSADINFGDNDKAVFGAGSDLSIYHDGSNSYIREFGAGDLKIQAINVQIENSSGVKMFKGVSSGEAILYHNNSQKLATTSTGIDVTGTVTADGLTVEGTNGNFEVATTGNSVNMTRAGNNFITASDSSGDLYLGAGGASFLKIDNGGDISFYEDTSTTAKLFWDASAESLGIGTSSIGSSTKLQVAGRGLFTDGLPDPADGSPAGVAIGYNTTSGYGFVQAIQTGVANKDLYLQPSGANNVIIANSGGNVGIGTSSPSSELHVKSTDGEVALNLEATTARLKINTNNFISATSSVTTFGVNGVERMRIDSSGNILASTDDAQDIGSGSKRFDDIHATNGTIQTSDRNEKQDIEELSDAEQRVAVACKGLLRKFRWKSAVAEKGNDARIHFGIIAQDLQDAFTAEGLDAGRYGMFISTTWTDEETGEERTRMGVRYSELLAFIISAI